MMDNTLGEGYLYIVCVKYIFELAVKVPVQAEKIIISRESTKPHSDSTVAIANNEKLWCWRGQNTIIISQR